MTNLTNLKIMLGMDENDTAQDKLLTLISQNTELQLRLKLGIGPNGVVPDQFGFIVLEVAVKRFNRLKNEGMSSYTQEGESISFNSNDFDDYQGYIDDYKNSIGKGVLKTIDPFSAR